MNLIEMALIFFLEIEVFLEKKSSKGYNVVKQF